MAKKIGKLLLFAVAIGTVIAAVYYFMKKKEAATAVSDEDEDFDDFIDDLEDDLDTASRTYVPLNRENGEASPAEKFTPLKEQVEDSAEETVEEFFDEEDAGSEDTLIIET
ncbi:MAG: hypothetical protein LBQ15_06905 [Clostridium sp.]|jgi:hypothetical protein|nr:hypothetical protein [Clostridium sp.]